MCNLPEPEDTNYWIQAYEDILKELEHKMDSEYDMNTNCVKNTDQIITSKTNAGKIHF